jgi:hypothetical protein
LKELERRILKNRRQKATHALSRFTLCGQRKAFRRKEDKQKGGYVDRYHSGLLILLTSAAGLTVLDALFTMMILDDGGWEINPVVRSVIQLYGNRFWVWKFVIVSFPLTILCLHSRFKLVMPAILGITTIIIIVILYQIFLYLY